MKTYIVGGYLRDQAMGIQTHDVDYVVVGTTPEEMLALGYTAVGQHFPVFLHPQTKAEYALARTERKVGPGYKGFTFHASPEVSLEEDLSRRDLTINALAQELDSNNNPIGPIIDLHGGLADIKNRVFRHVGPAFVEDPVRLLRVARFAARFPDFTLAPETKKLLQSISASGELKALVPERVFQELAKGIVEQSPVRMFEVLAEAQALSYFFPEAESANLNGAIEQLSRCKDSSLLDRMGLFLGSFSSEFIKIWCESYRVPAEIRDFALVIQYVRKFESSSQKTSSHILDLLDRADYWRKPERFENALRVLQSNQAALLSGVANKLSSLDLGVLANEAHHQKVDIKTYIRAKRIELLNNL